MTKTEKKNGYDLEDRTLKFAGDVRAFVRELPRSIANREDSSQVVRSSGSVGANYIEANEALSKKDFLMRIKISRKEAKETAYWLKLIDTGDKTSLDERRNALHQEARELMFILSSIMRKFES
ncbi:four helix bundle protein [Candidatus Kaiserbacteria bacterium RIFCSPLOWO2_02_FULL_54_13]|uniref:Four helix bundle protein n=1 Tax=Candidatus Kaiserbacteria bacterium RIFCSPHIGHO2_02_FULL_54_22 TaxID=1798495 RepID=A0A1F6DJA0_9BACT|nr:MAG: four helix bundle protein [Candidatus Kaiserbacteria bacterium RIFCSPHIGHO2_02_FULL_54_22]OGG68586.1 MAG: four helix bundle protein [Candidatus Kaiserbacteria bacterium RIFCSPHIGHO2_12_FULL_54_16]OGG82837.1 MAG: four helix bundle protein [Candidatus Kaiserbacteria bacterium RIFCSPLOWO2_02_FULL_54_13]OGG90355.1 MAG: four helix bundle protein [Candidatus Kaiserbacteria bacterium RIFCSPLOWO2_12_FULL_54_10]